MDPLFNRTLVLRLKSFLLLLIWIGKMLFNAAAISFMPALDEMMKHSGAPVFFISPVSEIAHQVLLFGLTFATFYLTYKLASSKPIPVGLLCQGSALAAFGWIAIRALFMELLPLAWHSGFLAGTITSMMALLLLAYCIAWVILIGACWIGRSPAFSGSAPRD